MSLIGVGVKCVMVIIVIYFISGHGFQGGGVVPVEKKSAISVESPVIATATSKPADNVSIPLWMSNPLLQRANAALQNKVNEVVASRKSYVDSNPTARSAIDKDVKFRNAWDIIVYIPRALQISLFAPFPGDWFKRGSFESNTFMRRISGVEMCVVYFALSFLPFSIWFWKKRVELWVIMFFSLGVLLIQGLIINNVGTLYRMRYGMLMILVALGMAGFIKLIKNKCVE